MKTLIVIPARYGSTRFPGKPLHPIRGRTLIQRVAQIAQQAAREAMQTDADTIDYVVATDHDAIASYCLSIGVKSVMTTGDIRNGSERALAAARLYPQMPDFIINLQGDVPFAEPAHVRTLIEAAAQHSGDVFTPVVRLTWAALDDLRERKKTTPFSGTTCARSADGLAFWFSKQIIPAVRGEAALRKAGDLSPVFRHIGLYGYRVKALERFCDLPMGRYEELEGLEQLRFLENGMTIRALEVAPARISMSGVDSLEDAQLAEQMIDRHGDPYQEVR